MTRRNIVGKIHCFGMYFWSHPQAWWKQESPCFHQALRWDRKAILQCTSPTMCHVITQKSYIECSDVWRCGAFIFRVTELDHVDTEVMQWMEMCLLYRMVVGSLANHICGRWRGGDGTVTSQWDWRIPKLTLLRASFIEDLKIMWTLASDIVYFCGSCCSGA